MQKLKGLVFFVMSAGLALVRAFHYSSKGANRGQSTRLLSMSSAAGAPSGAKLSIGSTLTNTDLALEAVRAFYPDASSIKITPTQGGVNNVVQYLEIPQTGEKKILRIYNNGNNTPRVAFEHEVLKQLGKSTAKMSFKIPKFVTALKDKSKTFVQLSTGASACIVDIIEGGLPKLTCVRDIGRASGELNFYISDIKLGSEFGNGPTPPYFELFKVHHAVTRDLFYKTMAGPAFDGVRSSADKMVASIRAMEKEIDALKALKLPYTLIHGDLHYDNVLVKDGRVTGLLDFEFASYDWRAMELAICLSKYAGEKDKDGNPVAMAFFEDFIDGFAEKGELGEQEIDAIPALINLRILSNVVYFVGRALGGEDDISSLTTRIANYCGRVDWITANSKKISDLIRGKMKFANDV